jgi:hypothetical protein
MKPIELWNLHWEYKNGTMGAKLMIKRPQLLRLVERLLEEPVKITVTRVDSGSEGGTWMKN